MPDRDIYRRAPTFAWRQTFRQIAGGASPRDIARPTRIALCHTLRCGGGVPGLGACADIVTRVKDGALHPLRAPQELRNQVRAHGGSQYTKQVAEAAERLVCEMLAGEPAPLEPVFVLAERACADLVESQLLQFVELNLVGADRRFATRSDALAWIEATREQVREDLVAIGRHLVSDEAAEHLRAPARPRRRQRTADLLHQGLGTAA